MFLKKEVELGVVHPGQNIKISFPFDKLGEIKNIRTTCDCTEAKRDNKKSAVIVYFKPKDVPQHLQLRGEFSHNIARTVEITEIAEDGTDVIHKLVFKATVRQRI